MAQILKAFRVLILFIITNAPNLCLISGVILILNYVKAIYGFDVMLLLTGCFLVFSSLVLELNKSKYSR